MNRESKRILGIDLLKCIAIVLVIVTHALQSSALMHRPVGADKITIVSTALFCIAMSCVPIFLMITGFLYTTKRTCKFPGRKHISFVFSYFIAISCSLLLDAYYHQKALTLRDIFRSFFDLNSGNYAWYARLYFLLLFLFPPLHFFVQGINEKKEFKRFLTTLVLISGVPPFFNVLSAKMGLAMSLPTNFSSLYPINCYLIGAYIQKYRPKYCKKKLLFLLSSLVVLMTILILTLNRGKKDDFSIYTYASIPYILISSILFLLLYDLQVTNSILAKILVSVSTKTFDMYLISHAIDRIIYPIYRERITNDAHRLYLLFIPVCITFIVSYGYSYAISCLLLMLKKKSLHPSKTISKKLE